MTKYPDPAPLSPPREPGTQDSTSPQASQDALCRGRGRGRSHRPQLSSQPLLSGRRGDLGPSALQMARAQLSWKASAHSLPHSTGGPPFRGQLAEDASLTVAHRQLVACGQDPRRHQLMAEQGHSVPLGTAAWHRVGNKAARQLPQLKGCTAPPSVTHLATEGSTVGLSITSGVRRSLLPTLFPGPCRTKI